MKISALIPNLATNSLGRSWPIVNVLRRRFDVDVLGALPDGREVYPPYAHEFEYTVVRHAPVGSVLAAVKAVERQITGDVVFAFKPLTLSFGAALLHRLRRRCPVVLDIEDWDTWSLHKDAGLRHRLRTIKHLIGPGWTTPHSPKFKLALEGLTGLARMRGRSPRRSCSGGSGEPCCGTGPTPTSSIPSASTRRPSATSGASATVCSSCCSRGSSPSTRDWTTCWPPSS
jgi:hypothetical protein